MHVESFPGLVLAQLRRTFKSPDESCVCEHAAYYHDLSSGRPDHFTICQRFVNHSRHDRTEALNVKETDSGCDQEEWKSEGIPRLLRDESEVQGTMSHIATIASPYLLDLELGTVNNALRQSLRSNSSSQPELRTAMSLVPPFTEETARAKVKKAQDLWNTR